MKLFYDVDSNIEMLVEDSINESTGLSGKKYKIKGIFTTIGEMNRNGRIYPKQIWETEVHKYQENFTNGSINTLMEWEHPSRTTVDPMESIAKIVSLRIHDKHILGEAVLLDNPKANQIKTLIDNGVKISVSSRGVGTVKNGIVENFKLITWDLVAAPSDYNATMNGLVESYQLNEGIINDLSFTIDSFGNIIQMKECISDCSTYAKYDVNKAITDKFAKILEELKYK